MTVRLFTPPDISKWLCKEWNGTTVINLHKSAPAMGGRYIGRGSPFGNPFVLARPEMRPYILMDYRAYVLSRPELMREIHDLEGRTLECFCDPLDCHGHVLIGLLRDGYGLF